MHPRRIVLSVEGIAHRYIVNNNNNNVINYSYNVESRPCKHQNKTAPGHIKRRKQTKQNNTSRRLDDGGGT